MKTGSLGRVYSGKKSMRYLVFAVFGIAVFGAAAMAQVDGMVGERVPCDDPGHPGAPCGSNASPVPGKEDDYMAITTSSAASDPTIQPIGASTAVVTQSATFALG